MATPKPKLSLAQAWRAALETTAPLAESEAQSPATPAEDEFDWDAAVAALESATAPEPEAEVGDTHEHIEDAEIVDPPASGEDMQVAHGGDDNCQDVEDAPAREDADGEGASGDAEPESETDAAGAGEQSETADTQAAEAGSAEGDPAANGSAEAEETAADQPGETDADAMGGDQAEAASDADGDQAEQEGEGEEQGDAEGEGEGGSEDKAEGDVKQGHDQASEGEEVEGARNAYEAFDLAAARSRRLQTAFATVVAKIAEDSADYPVAGDDEWDVQAIMERRVTRRPLSQCRQAREKVSVALVLDTSGSCGHLAEFYASIAEAASRAGDVEIFAAPNAEIIARQDERGVWRPYWLGQVWPFERRVVVFFGDFDGADSVVESAAQRGNRVYWLSSEQRYTDMARHSWCHYSLADFQGHYFQCHSENDFLRLVRKIR